MKLLLLMLCSLMVISAPAQVYFGPGVSTKGFSVRAGLSVSKVDLQYGLELPVFNQNVSPTLNSLSIGRIFTINESNYSDTKITLTPFIGVANYRTHYTPDDKTLHEDELAFMSTLRFSKQYHAGSLYVFTSYCKDIYVGIGITVFPSLL